jgi:hypothetical protein
VAAWVFALLHNAGMTRLFALFLAILAALFAAELTPPAQNVLVSTLLLWAAFSRSFIGSETRMKSRTAPASAE